jgi:pyruvate/2-oxoglutarate dehydrogenase complex dihydrolipoamide acyltransferase (E2) component
MKRTLIPALLALLAVVLAAGCGGGGSKENASGTTEATVTATTPATPTEVTETETTATETTGTNFASTANCREFAELAAKLQTSFSGTGGDLEETKKLLDAYAEKAPEEIRDDFRVIADYWTKIVEVLKGVNLQSGTPPSPEVLKKLQKVQNEIDQAKLQRANQNISNWANKNCR